MGCHLKLLKVSQRVLAVLACALMLQGLASADLADDLVAYWPLDGDFGDQVGVFDGEERGTDPIVFDTGQFGNGIVLNGENQYVEIMGGEVDDLNFVDEGSMSISAWFRVDAFDTSWQALIAKGEQDGWRLHRRGDGCELGFTAGEPDTDETFVCVDDGEIYHVVATSDEGDKNIYINGEWATGGFRDPIGVPTTSNRVRIGDNPSSPGREWEGLIDDVALWGRALTEDEVATIWNNGDGTAIGDLIQIGPPPPNCVGGCGTIGQQSYAGSQSNEVYGPVADGVSGFSATMVDSTTQIDSVTIAEIVLEDLDGDVSTGLGPDADDQVPYPVVDMGGGGGTFIATTLPYPNGVGVGDTSVSDFVVSAEADVIIPPGEYTIGIGSDDGGKITIPGVEFEYWSDNNGSLDDDQIRFEGTRGHGWTVGYFQLDEQLETTITAEFFERGGGDSFEVAVIEGEVIEDANPTTGWELLSDGVLGWSVTTTGSALLSADLTDDVLATRPWEFDVDGDANQCDQMVIPNPDPDVYTTILNVDGATFQIAGTGALANGDACQIVDADQIVGTPIITSTNPGQTWTFDSSTGSDHPWCWQQFLVTTTGAARWMPPTWTCRPSR